MGLCLLLESGTDQVYLNAVKPLLDASLKGKLSLMIADHSALTTSWTQMLAYPKCLRGPEHAEINCFTVVFIYFVG